MKLLAPIVLGDLDAAMEDGYIGAEWWTQSRAANDPKVRAPSSPLFIPLYLISHLKFLT